MSILLCTTILCLTGCGMMSLTTKESDMIAEYAAYVLVKHDKNYFPKLKDEVEEETTKVGWVTPNVPASVNQNGTGNTSTIGSTTETAEAISSKSMAEAMGVQGFDISYMSYEVMDKYEDNYFPLRAEEGQKLLVCRFELTNQTGQESALNILEKQLSFRCSINGEKRVNSQLTMLLNDMSSLKETFAANETKEAVLLFQIPDTYEGAISSLQLTIKNGEESNNYSLTD